MATTIVPGKPTKHFLELSTNATKHQICIGLDEDNIKPEHLDGTKVFPIQLAMLTGKVKQVVNGVDAELLNIATLRFDDNNFALLNKKGKKDRSGKYLQIQLITGKVDLEGLQPFHLAIANAMREEYKGQKAAHQQVVADIEAEVKRLRETDEAEAKAYEEANAARLATAKEAAVVFPEDIATKALAQVEQETAMSFDASFNEILERQAAMIAKAKKEASDNPMGSDGFGRPGKDAMPDFAIAAALLTGEREAGEEFGLKEQSNFRPVVVGRVGAQKVTVGKARETSAPNAPEEQAGAAPNFSNVKPAFEMDQNTRTLIAVQYDENLTKSYQNKGPDEKGIFSRLVPANDIQVSVTDIKKGFLAALTTNANDPDKNLEGALGGSDLLTVVALKTEKAQMIKYSKDNLRTDQKLEKNGGAEAKATEEATRIAAAQAEGAAATSGASMLHLQQGNARRASDTAKAATQMQTDVIEQRARAGSNVTAAH